MGNTTSRHRAAWAVENDDGDLLVAWRSIRSYSRTGENDKSMPVYLPSGKRARARAARIIADALNQAKIPRPRRRRTAVVIA